MAEIRWGGYLPDRIASANRTRDAIRRIRALAIEPTQKKKFLAEWFNQHPLAAPDDAIKRVAYQELLGADFYRKLRG